jgi:hypothetical protein
MVPTPHSPLPRVMHRVSSFLVSSVDLWKLFVLLRGLAFCHVMSFTKLKKRSPYKVPKSLFNFSFEAIMSSLTGVRRFLFQKPIVR